MSRVALVTGAARGIGAATVRLLLEQGWAVVATDRCTDDPHLPYALGTAAELDAVVAGHERGLAMVADATDEQAVRAAVATAVERFGGLDAAIGCAGVVGGGVPLWEQTSAQTRAVLDGNLTTAVVLAQQAIPAMLERPEPRSGRFVAVASAAATRGFPMMTAYCAGKAGIGGLVRALAAELGPHGLTANAVSPGCTETEMLHESARLYRLPDTSELVQHQYLGRVLTPEELARALVWLAGEGSGGVTGAMLPVDGGLSL